MTPTLAIAPLTVTATQERGHVRLALQGDLDVLGNRALRDAVVEALLLGAEHVEIDLTELGFVDASGLGSLIGARRRATEAGATLVITGAAERVRTVLDATGLTSYLSTP